MGKIMAQGRVDLSVFKDLDNNIREGKVIVDQYLENLQQKPNHPFDELLEKLKNIDESTSLEQAQDLSRQIAKTISYMNVQPNITKIYDVNVWHMFKTNINRGILNNALNQIDSLISVKKEEQRLGREQKLSNELSKNQLNGLEQAKAEWRREF